jgi:potassium-transporting ATPase KdpC subunit
MRRDIARSIIAIVVLTLLFGIVYPLATTGVAQVLFPNKADGSRIERDGETVGSRLIGQDFQRPVLGPDGQPEEDEEGNPVLEPDPRYFQSRPSATGYSANVTFFNNLGPNNQELRDLFAENLSAYLERERPYNSDLQPGDVPPDAVQTSASGVDPHISEANAEIQAGRVAQERGLELERVLELVEDSTDGRFLGVLGEPGVNVLELNLALDDEEAGR